MSQHREDTAPRLGIPQVVTLPREVDATNTCNDQAWLPAALQQALSKPSPVVIADMTLTTFCDSSGLRFLIRAHQQAADRGTDLRIVTSAPPVLRMLQVTGADQMLHLFPDMKTALSAPPHDRTT